MNLSETFPSSHSDQGTHEIHTAGEACVKAAESGLASC